MIPKSFINSPTISGQSEQTELHYTWHRLASAVILQAVCDTSKGDPEAEDWLMSDDCRRYCEYTGLDHRKIAGWVKDGKHLSIRLIRYVEPKIGLMGDER